LFYRLTVVTIDLPPLRDRQEDVLILADYFLQQFSRDAGRKPLQFSAEARRRLEQHSWPGNVRELRNLIERVAFLAPNDQVEAADLAFILSPDPDSAVSGTDLALTAATNRFQQEYIRRMIRRAAGNRTTAASLLGMHRS